MGGGFSKSAPPPKPTPPPISEVDRAMLDLKVARDRLHRYRRKLEADEIKLVAQAKAAKANGRTSQALGLLRLRKYKQQQAQSCEEQLYNVLTMVETIDSKQNEKQLLSAMAAGKDALKQMHEEYTVDHVLELMDQIQEELQVEGEINQILSQVPELSPADELAVEEELEAMMAAEAAQTNGELPVAPTTKLPEQELPTAPDKVPQREERVALPG